MAERKPDIIVPPRPNLGQMWQLPVLALSLVLFGLGLYLARPVDDPLRHVKALDAVQALINAGQYENAIAALNRIAPELAKVEPALRSRHQLLIGDVVYLGQKSRNWNQPANHQQVIDSYQAARALGHELSVERLKRLADSLVALNQTGAALELLAGAGDSAADSRQSLLKQIISASMRQPEAIEREILELIHRLLDEPTLGPANEAWAVARQGELAMRRGEAAGAIELLLRRITRLRDVAGAPLGELMVTLGKAYLAEGDVRHAEQWLMQARQRLDESEPLVGEALVTLGRVRFVEDNPAEAVEIFADAIKRFGDGDVYPRALLGKAESQVRLGHINEAMEDFAMLVKLAHTTEGQMAALATPLAASLGLQHDLRFSQGDYAMALRFIDLQAGLFGNKPPPAEVLLKQAMTHERLARQLMGLAEADMIDEGQWADLEPAKRQEVAEHFAAAAAAYHAHALAVTKENAEAYGQSMWRAGDYYDRAGLHRKAITVFREFIDDRPSDARRLSAMYRLAQAHQADGQFEQSIALYEEMIDKHPTSPEAYQSLVPLARSYLAKGPKFAEQAERVLRMVVTNHPALRPESQEYRDALIELGQLYYRRGDEGDFEKAIERLSEVVERYADDHDPLQHADLQFQLADAHRKSVEQIDQKLAGSLPPGKRAEFAAERARRLEKAGESFKGVIDILQQADESKLGDLHQLFLRNSFFYRADCAYDLGRYEGPEGSIALYETAIQKYDKHPASLVAMIQIVNSYGELKQWDKARAANERAKVRLKAIPDEAFNDPNLPMGRAAWQRWLDWNMQLDEPTVNAEKP